MNGTCFIDGAGSFKQTSKEESSYDTLVPCYEGTLFENIINDLSGVRTRVMVVSKHTTYSIHKDRTKRYHLALITNPHAFFLFPNAGLHNPLVHIPIEILFFFDQVGEKIRNTSATRKNDAATINLTFKVIL